MNNVYRKVAVAYVCTALAFVLGASKEVKAATITLTPTIKFGVNTTVIRYSFPISELSPEYDIVFSNTGRDGGLLKSRLAEFNISSFFLLLIQLLGVLFFRIRFPVSERVVLLVWYLRL